MFKVITNQFHATCCDCKKIVAAGEGKSFLRVDGDKWSSAHDECYEAIRDKDFSWDDDATLVAPQEQPVGKPLGEAVAEATASAEKLMATLEQALSDAVDAIAQRTAESFSATVPAMVAELLATARPLEISIGTAPKVTVARAHKKLATVLTMVAAGASPFLVGPAGSGKTTLAEQIATALGRKFYMAARVTSEYKLVGFIDAQGRIVRTQFREAYEHGGIFLFDEVDASDPDALTAFNAALANGLGDFPDDMVPRHKDFSAIAAGNTFGRGADRQYVGRNQLDAATLDRFQTVEIDYDEALEPLLAGNDEWTRYVQSVRHAIEQEKVRHIVSPRASISGARLLAAGMERSEVIDCCIWKGLDAAQRTRVESRIGSALSFARRA